MWYLCAFFAMVSIAETVVIVRKDLLKRRHRQVHAKISEVAVKLRDCDNNTQVYENIIQTLIELFPSSSCGSLLVVDESNSKKMHFAAQVGYSENLEQVTISTDNNYLYKYNKNARAAIIRDPLRFDSENLNEKEKAAIVPQAAGLNQTISTPLFYNGELYGLINIDAMGKSKFKRSDLALMVYIMQELGLLLEYVVMKNEMNYKIEYDSLTAIHSRNMFLGKVEEYLTSNKRTKPSVFVMIDLDDFKVVNDTFGHVVGDLALKSFGTILKCSMGINDECGRYGGDEFCILFRDCTKEQAVTKLKDLKKNLQNNPYHEKRAISFSYGCVEIAPEDECSVLLAINASDRAMYEYKANKKKQCATKC